MPFCVFSSRSSFFIRFFFSILSHVLKKKSTKEKKKRKIRKQKTCFEKKKALKRKRNREQEILKQKTIFPISFSALLPKMAFVLFGHCSVFCLEQFSSSVYEYDCSGVFLILTRHLFFLHRLELSATVFRPRLGLDGRLITHFYHSYEHSLAHSHDHSLISSFSISTWLTSSF